MAAVRELGIVALSADADDTSSDLALEDDTEVPSAGCGLQVDHDADGVGGDSCM